MIHECEINWYKQIKDDLEVVFDVGCRDDNVFYKIDPTFDIHLFDPVLPKREMHGKFNNFALSDKKRRSRYYPEYGSMLKRSNLNAKGGKWAKLKHDYKIVEVDTVDNYCKKNKIAKIDLLKIDAEGSDYKVLLGAKKMLPKIKYIQFEHWDDETTEKIKDLLDGFEVSELGGKPMNYKAKKL